MKMMVLKGFLIAMCLILTGAGGFLVGKNLSFVMQEFIYPTPERQLERKIEGMLGLFVGHRHVMAVVRADTTPVQETHHTRQFIPQNAGQRPLGYDLQEITQTRKGEQLNRLYVTVLIDGMSAGGLYQHPSAYQTEQMTTLIQNVVGYEAGRQDNVKLMSVPFLSSPPTGGAISGFLCGLVFMCLGFGGVLQLNWDTIKKQMPLRGAAVSSQDRLNKIRQSISENPRHVARLCMGFVQNAASARRLAVLLLALGEESIKPLFLNMPDTLVRRLAHFMAQTTHIPADKVQQIAVEFEGYIQGDKGIRGGKEQVEQLFTYPPEKKDAATPLKNQDENGAQTIWDKMKRVPLEQLKDYLVREYPQTIALILYHLPTEIGEKLVPLFPENLKIDVLLRLSALSPVDGQTLQVIEEQLQGQFAPFLTGKTPMTGKEKVSALLSAMDRNTEGVLLQDLYERSPDLAHDIQQGMLLFDDLEKLPSDLFQYLLNPENDAVWALALKGATEQMKQKVSAHVSPVQWKKILSCMQGIQTPKIKDIDEAQHTLVRQAQQQQLFEQEVS